MSAAPRDVISGCRNDGNIILGSACPEPHNSVGFGITNACSPLTTTMPRGFSLRFVSGAVTAYHAKRLTSRDPALQSP